MPYGMERDSLEGDRNIRSLNVSKWDFGSSNSRLILLLDYFMLSPLPFSVGTSKRSYRSIAVDGESTFPERELIPFWVSEQRADQERAQSWPPQSWISRGENRPWGRLVQPTTPGNLICVTRGKLILLAAGHVS